MLNSIFPGHVMHDSTVYLSDANRVILANTVLNRSLLFALPDSFNLISPALFDFCPILLI